MVPKTSSLKNPSLGSDYLQVVIRGGHEKYYKPHSEMTNQSPDVTEKHWERQLLLLNCKRTCPNAVVYPKEEVKQEFANNVWFCLQVYLILITVVPILCDGEKIFSMFFKKAELSIDFWLLFQWKKFKQRFIYSLPKTSEVQTPSTF